MRKLFLNQPLHALSVGTNRLKRCRLTLVSGSTNAKHVVLCSSRREGIVAFSALMAQLPVRPYSKEVVHVVRRSYHGIIS